jgi:hypothetical protein
LNHAEARGKVCYIDKLREEDCEDLYEVTEHDMEAIRTVVSDAAKREWHSGPVVILADLIDREDMDEDGDAMMED